MMIHYRAALWGSLSLLAAVLSGCGGCGPGANKQDAGPDDEGCVIADDCPDSRLFACERGACVPTCRSKNDCSAEVRGQFALDYCAGGAGLGCQCDEGQCVSSLCSADSDCGGQVCRNGKCEAAPEPSTVTSCRISPDMVVLTAGAKTKFWVSTWAGGSPVVLKNGVAWSPKAGLAGSGTGSSIELTAPSAINAVSGPIEVVSASVGAATCKAQAVLIPPPSNSQSVNAVVLDELSGRPISGAIVVASLNDTGAPVTQGGSNVQGLATLDVSGGPPKLNFTAFHKDYGYLTVANYSLSAPSTRVLSFVLKRNPTDKYGGYRGGMKNSTGANIQFAFAGASLGGSITDLSLSQILGPSEPKDIKIGTIEQKDVPIPSGVFLAVSDNAIKNTVSAQGSAGVCFDSSGVPQDEKIASGSCGTRTAWAITGTLRIDDLSRIIAELNIGSNFDLSSLDYGKVLAVAVPLFKSFKSSVIRDVSFDLKPTARDANGKPDFSNTSHFTVAEHDFAQVPLGFAFAVKTPNLPQYGGAYPEAVAVLGAASIPGQGVVPLGLGAAVNRTPADSQTDVVSPLSTPGLIPIRMAPTHHGLEGAPYGLVSLALKLNTSVGLATSAIYGRVPNNQLLFDPNGSSPVELKGKYLPFPENAAYNFLDNARGEIPGRTFRMSQNPVGDDISLVRVVLSDAKEHDWVVYLSPTDAAAGIRLPSAPSGFEDRTFSDGNPGSKRSSMYVQLIRLMADSVANTGAISFQQFVEHNSTNADRFAEWTTAFSVVDYNRPEVQWLNPNQSMGNVPAGAKVKVKISDFKIGVAPTNGSVKVTFLGAPPACVAIDASQDTSNGKNEVEITLPPGCTGSNIDMTATLYDAYGQLSPTVSDTVKVNIQ